MAFTKGATDNELLLYIPELNTHKFDNYDGLSTSPAVGTIEPNYIYDNTNNLISRSSSISKILPAAYTIVFLVRYWINGLSGRNRSIDFKKLRNFFLFKPDNTVMRNLEAKA